MDPMSIISNLLTTANYIQTAFNLLQSNREECQRLVTHANQVLTLIKYEYELRTVPEDHIERLRHLARAFSDLRSLAEDLASQPILKRLLWRDEVARKIVIASRHIHDAVETFQLISQVDLRRYQEENEEARRRDTEEHRNVLDQVVDNDLEILRFLGIQKSQMQEAMMSIHKRLNQLNDSIERRFLNHGLQAMQRLSGPMIMTPDKFLITSLDITVYEDRKLGEGGFSTVWEGDYLGTIVAVKKMEKGVPDHILQAEIRIWKELRHQHILQFFGACSLADPPFIVSAFKHNRDASSFLRKNPTANRVRIMHEASLGLVYLHANNVVHGDLKAANILIDEHGSACLSDFGLSVIKEQTTILAQSLVSALPVGTVQWMAPERMSHGSNNMCTDIYSFGMTIYEIFTDKAPFSGIHMAHLYQVVVTEGRRPPDPRSDRCIVVDYGLDDSMWNLMNQCWDRAPENRPSARSVESALGHGQNFPRPTYPPPRVAAMRPAPLITPATTPSPSRASRFSALRSPANSDSLIDFGSTPDLGFGVIPTDTVYKARRSKGLIGRVSSIFKGPTSSQTLHLLLNATTPSPFDIQFLYPTPFPPASVASRGLPLDISLRLLLIHVQSLSDKRHSMDRIVTAFADRWVAQYPNLMTTEQVVDLSFSLIMLNTDYFNKNTLRKTSKEDFLKDMSGEDLGDVILEYFYDNVTRAPFLYLQDLDEIKANQGSLRHTPTVVSGGSQIKVGSEGHGSTMAVYSSLGQDQLNALRTEVNSHIPEAEPFSYFPLQSGVLDYEECLKAWSKASPVQVRSSVELPTALWPSMTAFGPTKKETVSQKNKGKDTATMLKLVKVGILEQSEDGAQHISGNNINAQGVRWCELGVALTGSQMFFFRNPQWIIPLKYRADVARERGKDPPRQADFKPDEVVSLDNAIALYDTAYPDINKVFRLVLSQGQQYFFRAPPSSDNSELDDWLSQINFVASFRAVRLSLPSVSSDTDLMSRRQRSPFTRPDSFFQPVSPGGSSETPISHSNSPFSLDNRSPGQTVRSDLSGLSEQRSARDPTGWQSAASVTPPGSHISSNSDATSVVRVDALQREINRLNERIRTLDRQLEPDLRTARNLAIATPFQQSMREKIQRAVLPLARRIKEMRLDLVKLRCYRDVLIADLASEKRAWDAMIGSAEGE